MTPLVEPKPPEAYEKKVFDNVQRIHKDHTWGAVRRGLIGFTITLVLTIPVSAFLLGATGRFTEQAVAPASLDAPIMFFAILIAIPVFLYLFYGRGNLYGPAVMVCPHCEVAFEYTNPHICGNCGDTPNPQNVAIVQKCPKCNTVPAAIMCPNPACGHDIVLMEDVYNAAPNVGLGKLSVTNKYLSN